MPASRRTLQRDLQEAARALSAATVTYHRLVARCLGLNDTDHKCLDILLREGAMTAGDLAVRGGYTTGAVTGIVNRLVARGMVVRAPDPDDRRRVVLQPIEHEVHERMWPLLKPMIQRFASLHERYSARELALLLDYLQQSAEVLQASAEELAERVPQQSRAR